MKDFKKMVKMADGGGVRKYEDGGKVYLGKAPDTGTIVRMNPKPSSDGNIYWTGSEPTVSDKIQRAIGKGAERAITGIQDTLTKGALTKKTVAGMLDPTNPDKKKRGGKVKRGKVTKKKK